MENFMILGNNTIQLHSGVFAGVQAYSRYPTGELEGIRLSEKNMLVTHVGELVPTYTETTRRKNKYSVEFHKNGMVKAVALDEQQEIQGSRTWAHRIIRRARFKAYVSSS